MQFIFKQSVLLFYQIQIESDPNTVSLQRSKHWYTIDDHACATVSRLGEPLRFWVIYGLWTIQLGAIDSSWGSIQLACSPEASSSNCTMQGHSIVQCVLMVKPILELIEPPCE